MGLRQQALAARAIDRYERGLAAADKSLDQHHRRAADKEKGIDLAALEPPRRDLGRIVARNDPPGRDPVGGEDGLGGIGGTRLARAERHALALEICNSGDVCSGRCHHMHVLGKQVGDHAHMALRACFTKSPRSGRRFRNDIGLGHGRIGSPVIDVENIGNGARAGAHRRDEPRRPAHPRDVATGDARRVTDDRRYRLADREIGPARRACRDEKGQMRSRRLGGSKGDRRGERQCDRGAGSKCGQGREFACHRVIGHRHCVNISMLEQPAGCNPEKMLKRLLKLAAHS